MTREQLDQLRDQYLSVTFDEIEARLALDWSEVGLDVHRDDLCAEAESLSGGLANVDYRQGMPWARSMLPEAEEGTLRMLSRRLMEAKLEAIKAELDALNGEPLRAQPRLAEAHAAAGAETPLRNPPASLRLSEVARLYAEERVSRNSWTTRSAAQYREIHAVIVNLLGDPAVAEVTKAAIRQLGLDLAKYPSNAKKRFVGLSPKEALAAADLAADVARLSPNSVNQYQQAARSLFKWAEENDHVQQSPASILRDVQTSRAKDDRKPFDDDDLIKYFAKLGPGKPYYMYWIPRILAYSGCRLGEIAQLEKADIRKERDVWVIDVNDNHPSKRLKNESSKRLVPVHPRLVELGLLTFVESGPDGFLWPITMRTAPDGRSPIDRLQKKLAFWMRSNGITDKKKTAAHSFRHTVATRLASTGANEYDISSILGHEHATMTTRRYMDHADVTTLLQVISRLRLPI